jgi:hypothetical protein
MGLSIRAYARHRGVSHVAVMKALRAGRISAEADGSIDPNHADQAWAKNSEPPRVSAAHRAAPVAMQATVRDAPAPALPTGGTSLLQARTVNEVVKAQTNKVRLAQLKGEVVDRAAALAHVFTLARAERDAWLNWPARIVAPLAAQFGVDAHALHLALDAAVREHLQELGEIRPRVD